MSVITINMLGDFLRIPDQGLSRHLTFRYESNDFATVDSKKKNFYEIWYEAVSQSAENGVALKIQGSENDREVFSRVRGFAKGLGDDLFVQYLDRVYSELASRYPDSDVIPEVVGQSDSQDLPLEEVRAAMHRCIDDGFKELVGVETIRETVSDFAALAFLNECRRREGLDFLEQTSHLVMLGNPGTGKTTVARIIGKLYHSLGILPEDKFVEITRDHLVGKHIGHTEARLQTIFEKARGGVLFIDEAYSLAPKEKDGDKSDFGYRAIDSLVVESENSRNNLVIVLAGYPDEMERMLASNPGLKSRFPTSMDFPDYSKETLTQILEGHLDRTQMWDLIIQRKDLSTADSIQPLTTIRRFDDDLAIAKDKPGFGNARWVRSWFEQQTRDYAQTLFKADVQIPKFGKNHKPTDGITL